MNNILFTGSITSRQPLATCSLGLKERENPSGKGATPVPTAMTENGKRLMFPASGLRGAIRRFARDAVRHFISTTLSASNIFTLEEHYFLTQGGIKGVGEQSRSSIVDLEKWRKLNPLLDLFGAGDAGFLGFVQGKVSIGNAICQDAVEPDVFSGTRVDDLYRHPEQIQYLSEEDVEKLVQQAIGGKQRSEIQSKIKAKSRELKSAKRANNDDLAEKLNKEIKILEDELKQVKEETGAHDVSVGMPLPGFKTIPAGSTMDHTMRIHQSSDIALGLFLESLNLFSLNPVIGAHSAVGCGEISGEWDVYTVDLESGKKKIGHVKLGGFEPAEIDGEVLLEARQAFRAFIESQSFDFSVPSKEEK